MIVIERARADGLRATRAGFARAPALVVAVLLVGVGAWLLLSEEPPTERRVVLGDDASERDAAPADVRAAEAEDEARADERRATPSEPLDPRAALDAKLLRVHGALAAWSAAHSGNYPTTLDALVQPDSDGRRHLTADDIVDPWGRPLVYVAPSNRAPYQLHSFGRDGAPGGTGEDADRFIADLAPR